MSVTRRTLLTAASAAPLIGWAGTDSTKRLIKPKALKDGDTIAVIAPSSAVDDPADFDKGRVNIEALGFKVKTGDHVHDNWGYFAGTDEHRAADLNAAFADPEVNGIICLRGGYGAGRILDLLDYDAIRRNPKVLVGYSDITALLLALYVRSGVVSFHGPVAVSSFGEFDVENLTKAIKITQPIGTMSPPVSPQGAAPQPEATTLFPGKASGRLVGGNLSVVVSIAGSPYLPSFDGHILFLEDVDEDPYRIDRMLNTLRISGVMKGVRGLVFGDFSAHEGRPDSPPADPTRTFTMLQVLQNFADQVRVPTFCGAWFGHIREKDTLPIGVKADMDADARTLTILEAGVI